MSKPIDMTGWKMWEHGVPDSRYTVIRREGLKNVLKNTTNTREKIKNFLEKTVFVPSAEKKSCLVMKKCVLHVDKETTKEESQSRKNRE